MAVQPDGDTSDALHLRSDASDKLDSVTRRYSMSASLATVGPDADMEIPKPSSILPADADVPRQIPDATSTPSTPSLVSTGSTTPGYICDGNSPCLDLDAIRWQEKVPVPEKGDDASSNKSNTRLDSMAIDKVGHEHEKRFTGGCLGMNEDDSAEARTFDDEASHKALEPQGAGEPSSDGATDEEPLSPAVSTGSSYDSAADDTDRILNYVLQLVYGADLEDLPGLPLGACRSLVAQFVSELGSAVDEGYHKASPSSSTPVQEQHPGGAGGIPGASSGGGAGSGKRKASLDDFEWSAEDMAGGDNGADSAASSKKTRSAASERLQISCPFRKRNPTRFNVRSHHSCALTSFPKLSELRQHVAKKHRRRPSPLTGSDLASPWGARSSFPRMSQHVCIRCSEPFASRAALEAHLRLPPEEICRSSGAISTSTDPEDGLDNETMDRLLDRGRKTLGAPPEVQWRELWSIIFPDDDEGSVPSFSFVPPVEHHELLSRLNDSLTRLSTQLLPLLHQFLISGSAQRNQLDGDHSHGIAAAADATEAVTKMVVSHICLLADQCVTEAARVTDAHHNRHTAAMAASATLLQATGSNPSSFSPLSGHHNQQQLPWTSMPGPTGTPTAGVSFLPSATLEGVEPPPLQQQPFMPIVFSQQTSSLPYHPARHMPVYHHALPQSSLSSFRGHHGRSQSATIGATAGWQQPPAGHAHVVPATVTGGELLAGSFSGNIDQLARWIAGTSNGYGPPDSDLNLELDDENHQDH